MTTTPLQISYVIKGEQKGAEFAGDLYEGLFHAARQLTGQERLRLIGELLTRHAEIESEWR
ncbi:MAG: hypothetical protein WBZ57_12145 [Pseudomonas graminis]